MAVTDRVRAGVLFDLYGPLLTDHQQDVWQLYYLEDWSLAEIGAAKSVSRAAIHDVLDRTLGILEEFESHLGLLDQWQTRRKRLRELVRLAGLLPTHCENAKTICAYVNEWADEEGLGDV